jgi:hypothetical protein
MVDHTRDGVFEGNTQYMVRPTDYVVHLIGIRQRIQ